MVIARELTKRFETIARVPLAEARAWVEADADRRRGEFVLVIEARPVEPSSALDPRAVLEALLAELPVKQAVALAVEITGGAATSSTRSPSRKKEESDRITRAAGTALERTGERPLNAGGRNDRLRPIIMGAHGRDAHHHATGRLARHLRDGEA